MIFTFRPCNRRAHYRKRRVPRFVVSLLLSLLCITAVVVPAMGVDTDNCRADVLHLFYLTLNFGCIFKALYRIFGSRRNTENPTVDTEQSISGSQLFPVSKSKKSGNTASAAPPLRPFCRAEKPTRQNVFVSDHPERSG